MFFGFKMASALKSEITSVIECTICMRVPFQDHIYQCSNGHVICKDCRTRTKKTQYEQSLESDTTYVSHGVQYISRLYLSEPEYKCPTCNVNDSGMIIRNMVAEKLAKHAIFQCENLGCYVELKEVKKKIDISIRL